MAPTALVLGNVSADALQSLCNVPLGFTDWQAVCLESSSLVLVETCDPFF